MSVIVRPTLPKITIAPDPVSIRIGAPGLVSGGGGGGVPTSRLVSAGPGLVGGGDLSADVLLSLDSNYLATLSQNGLLSAADFDAYIGDSRSYEVLFDDEFTSLNSTRWTPVVSGAGAQVAVTTLSTFAGMLRLYPGTTATGISELSSFVNFLYTNRFSRVVWEVKAKIDVLSDGTNEYDLFLCYTGSSGASLSYDRNVATTWQVTKWNAGAPTHTNTSVVVDTNLHSFRWVWTAAAGGTVQFFIDGLSVGSVTGVALVGVFMSPGRMVKSAGTAGQFVYIDRTKAVGQLATARA